MTARAAVLSLAVLLGCAGSATAQTEPEREQKRPNILVVMTDDQTLESMRVMEGVRSALGEEGTTFERAFVSNPLCCPSRSTLFTGQYAHNHGVLGNSPPDGGYGRLNKTEWLPIWLQEAGYRTVHIGKFLNRYGVDSLPTEVPPGWSEWYASVDPSTYQFYGYTLNENGFLNTYGADRNPLFYSTDYYAARARSVIQRMGETRTPFFLSLAFLAPHSGGPRDADDPPRLATPSPAPRHINRFAGEPLPFESSFNESDVSDKPTFIQARPPINAVRARSIEENYRQRLESLLAIDEAVVGLVDSLRAVDELDNTLIMFTSDNGFFHGEHRLPSGKVLVYEPSIRRAAPDARAGCAGGGAPAPARDERRPGADHPRGRRGEGRSAPGRALAVRAAGGPWARVGQGSLDRGRTGGQPARLRRAAHLPLRLRAVRQRGTRAIRPRA